MSHCSDCGRNLSESGGGDCETCSGVCEPDKPLAKRLQEIIDLPVRTDFDRGYQACAKMVLGSVEAAAAQQTIDSQAFEAYQNQYYQNNLRQ